LAFFFVAETTPKRRAGSRRTPRASLFPENGCRPSRLFVIAGDSAVVNESEAVDESVGCRDHWSRSPFLLIGILGLGRHGGIVFENFLRASFSTAIERREKENRVTCLRKVRRNFLENISLKNVWT
jgi:hypothetical protein